MHEVLVLAPRPDPDGLFLPELPAVGVDDALNLRDVLCLKGVAPENGEAGDGIIVGILEEFLARLRVKRLPRTEIPGFRIKAPLAVERAPGDE